jgi:hypothetical protein
MEDVRFLKDHAIEESYLMMGDSAKRDVAAYPSPSEFSIQLNMPFKNVIGVDLVNADVPRSEYTVEDGKNSLVVTCNGVRQTVHVEPGDYNLLQLCDALTQVLDGVSAEPHSTPYTKTSRTRLFSTMPFTFHSNLSSLASSLGFHTTQKAFVSEIAAGASEATFSGPFPSIESVSLVAGTVIRQKFVALLGGPASGVTVQSEDGSADVEVRIVDEEDNVLANGTIIAGTAEVEVLNVASDLVAGETYYVEVSSSGASVYVGSASGSGAPYAAEVNEGDDEWIPLESGDALSAEVRVDALRHSVTSPGLADLTGERYVLVRCPEVESFLHRDRAFEVHHPGLGMVKLGSNGIQEQRFDFVSFPPRKLTTPIGKLSQLSFRLEKPNGTLYNTRGLNHLLLVAVRYYSIVHGQKQGPEGGVGQDMHDKVLNPGYTPNFTHHLQERWRDEINLKNGYELQRASRNKNR